MKKSVVILGSTGSIGTQGLSVIQAHPDSFELVAIVGGSNAALLAEQAKIYAPKYVGIANEHAAQAVSWPSGVQVETGEHAVKALAALEEADIVLHGISGIAGLEPLLSALYAGKTVALANKESIVCGNVLVQEALRAHNGTILPVDSEHSALFQCLQNGKSEEVRTLHLTASGGPFYGYTDEALQSVTKEQALKHPVWSMGSKVTIDSATLFNKGLELIEASFLFRMPEKQISVLIHPQSIVHSMVEYIDGSVIAQLSSPDMRLAIQYALGYPARIERQVQSLSLPQIGSLTFMDGNGYPAIKLAREALKGGAHLPVVYNAANEAAVSMFLQGEIGFMDIRRAVEYAMEHSAKGPVHSLESIMQVDCEARRLARRGGKGKH